MPVLILRHGRDCSHTHTHKYISSLYIYMFIYRIKNPWSSGRSIQDFVCVLNRHYTFWNSWSCHGIKKQRFAKELKYLFLYSTMMHFVLRRRKGLKFSKFNFLKKKFNCLSILLSSTSRNNLQKASVLFKRDTPLATNDLNLDRLNREIHLQKFLSRLCACVVSLYPYYDLSNENESKHVYITCSPSQSSSLSQLSLSLL